MSAPQAGRVLHENGPQLVAFRNAVGLTMRRAMNGRPPVADQRPVMVELCFWITRPRTVTRESPATKPDLDKLTRAVLDALTNVVYRDDGQVCAIVAMKGYADERNPVGVDIRAHLL